MLDQSEESIKTRDAHPALPHPAEKQAAPPRPAKLAKSAGRSGAKLTADSIENIGVWRHSTRDIHVMHVTHVM